MSIVCAISGEVPEVPCISHVSGHVFERRLLEKWIEDKGTDPVNHEPLAVEQVTDIKNTESVVRPRAPAWTSVPGILKALQDEWDALMLHQYSLREQLEQTRQELSHTLYQHDAACRVIARLQRETAEAKEALATLRPMMEQELLNGHGDAPQDITMKKPVVMEPRDMEVGNADLIVGDDGGLDNADGNRPLAQSVLDEILKSNEELTKSRKKRQKDKNAWPDLVKQEEIANFSLVGEARGFHSTSHPGIMTIDINEQQYPSHVITGGTDKTAVFFNLESDSIVQTMKGHGKRITQVMLHPSEPMALTASVDQTVKLWALNNQEDDSGLCLETFNMHKATVSGISLHPIGKYLISAGLDGTWNFLDLPSSTILTKVHNPDFEHTACHVHPDGRIFATGTTISGKSSVLIWDISEREQVAEFEGHGDSITDISFSDNGYFMASSSKDGTVKIFDLRKLKCRETIPVIENAPVYSVQFDDSGTYLAATAGNDIRVYTTGRQWSELTRLQGHEAPVTSLRYGKDGQMIFSGSLDSSIHISSFNNEEMLPEGEEAEVAE